LLKKFIFPILRFRNQRILKLSKMSEFAAEIPVFTPVDAPVDAIAPTVATAVAPAVVPALEPVAYPTEDQQEAPFADPAGDVFAPTESTAIDSAAAGDGPITPTRSLRRKFVHNCHLKSLEECTTSILGDDLALFAEFDEEGSPRLTRTQTRKRRSGVVTPPPQPKKKDPRGRKSDAERAADRAAKMKREAGDATEHEYNDNDDDIKAPIDDAGEEMEMDAAVDMMERGELPAEDVEGDGMKIEVKADAEQQPAASEGENQDQLVEDAMQPEAPAEVQLPEFHAEAQLPIGPEAPTEENAMENPAREEEEEEAAAAPIEEQATFVDAEDGEIVDLF